MITRIKAANYRSLADLEFIPNDSLNIFIGDNEVGKSTILEVISLVLGGRVRGRWAAEDLNPHWFNQKVVRQYFDDLLLGTKASLPEIDLEIFFSNDTVGAERLRGVHNSLREDCPGLRMKVMPDPGHAEELAAYLALPDLPALIPTDLLMVDWRSFAGERITRQPRGLGFAMVNVNAGSSTSGIDFKLRQLVRDFVTPAESAKIALDHRLSKESVSTGILQTVNDRIAAEGSSFGVSLRMDQGANANWDSLVAPHIDSTPFSLLGHGRQVSTKIALAMSRSAEHTQFVLIEEPENHLSHTKMMEMLADIQELSGSRQLFITTHSAFVLNRLKFDALHLMNDGRITALTPGVISADTVRYFQKQSGYDTLRLAVASKVVVVEGPSDEMIFNLAYSRLVGVEPRERGIDVVALGTRGKRALELAKALGKKIAVLRDNDGKEPSHWIGQAGDLVEPGERELFIGAPSSGHTLEPQFITANGEDRLRSILDLPPEANVEKHMLADKTEAAWKIMNSQELMDWPDYIRRSIEFINAV